ncbi:FUN14 domain-containing protein [Infirmifilum sp.]|uniref:FUN14 domain-containing protein n=1 Tax=Infirmifilum sp. TaxID=2856575 RepID=UPI003D11BE5D
MIEALSTMVASFGAGYAVGWALRRVVSVIETVVALYIAATAVLVYAGVVTVNFNALINMLEGIGSWLTNTVGTSAVVAALGVLGVPFSAGVVTGFMRARMPAFSATRYNSPFLSDNE